MAFIMLEVVQRSVLYSTMMRISLLWEKPHYNFRGTRIVMVKAQMTEDRKNK